MNWLQNESTEIQYGRHQCSTEYVLKRDFKHYSTSTTTNRLRLLTPVFLQVDQVETGTPSWWHA